MGSNPLKDLDFYNDATAAAVKYESGARLIWCTTLFFSSVVISVAVFLLYKTTKVTQKNFFLLMNFLTIVAALGGILGTRLIYEIFNEVANLPAITVVDLRCFPPINLNSTSCDSLMQQLDFTDTYIAIRYVLISWGLSIFGLGYLTFHLIFSMKYWTLSLKI